MASVLAAAGVAHDIYDEAPRSGGNLDRRRFDAPPADPGARRPRPLLRRHASVLAVSAERVVEFIRDGGIEQRAYQAVFICTGAYDLQLPTAGRAATWSSAGALQALLKGQGIVPQRPHRAERRRAVPHHRRGRPGARRRRVTDIVDSVSLADYAALLPHGLGSPAAWAVPARAGRAPPRARHEAAFRRAGGGGRARSRCGSPTGGCCRSTGSASATASRRRPSSPARPAAARPIAGRGHYFYTATDAGGPHRPARHLRLRRGAGGARRRPCAGQRRARRLRLARRTRAAPVPRRRPAPAPAGRPAAPLRRGAGAGVEKRARPIADEALGVRLRARRRRHRAPGHRRRPRGSRLAQDRHALRHGQLPGALLRAAGLPAVRRGRHRAARRR